MNANTSALEEISILYLTLTRVVFEYQLERQNEGMFTDLTLTRVVFELRDTERDLITRGNLTLTRVVFE